MSEDYVKKEVFEIWTDTHKELQTQQADHQNQILASLSTEIKRIADEGKETNKNVERLIGILKKDNQLTRNILDQHIIEYENNLKQNDKKFVNLFKRQETHDKIILESTPVWKFWSTLSKKAKTFLSTVILALAVLAAQNAYTSWSNGDNKVKGTQNENKTENK
jgi:hypothetical protein